MDSIIEEKNKFGSRTDKNLSTVDAGCIGGGKGLQADLLKVGVNCKPTQLLPAMLKEQNQRGVSRVDKAFYPLGNKHRLHWGGGRPQADLSKVGLNSKPF
jgi:hypothetical protein